MTIFNKDLKERIVMLETVIDALLTLLIRKGTITHDDMQNQIITNADERENDGDRKS